MDEELKPCPFCGNNDIGIWFHGSSPQDPKGIDQISEVFCCECKSSSGVYDTEDEAITAWNTRCNQNSCPDEWDNALRMLLQAVSKITKLIKNEI